MKKLKLFIENLLVYGLGGIISKAIPLIMVPIVTRILPNSDYFGLNDLSHTVVSFATALAGMGMYDAVFRMFFEKDDEDFKKGICSTALMFVFVTSGVVALLLLAGKDFIAELFFKDPQYAYLVYICAISTFVGGVNSIFVVPSRAQNQRKIFLLGNALGPILSYSIAIPLLLNGYYVVALPAAGLASAVIMAAMFLVVNRGWFSVKRFHWDSLKQMLKIAIPLLPNFIIYWLFNSSDRVMIANILSVGETGIYSVGAKLGHASHLIYTAFAGGWQYFAFSTMNEKDQVKSNSVVFEYLGVISFGCTAFVFALAEPIYSLLFAQEYLPGFIISPYLFLAPLLQMLFQVAANQFLVIKKTWPNILILGVGAGMNVLLNAFLIPVLGIEGAAIATLLGYAISNVLCVIVLCKMKLMVISGRFLAAVATMLAFVLVWRFWAVEYVLISLGLAVILLAWFLWLYRGDIKTLIGGIKK